MTDPSVLWDIADGADGGAPPTHFEYRDDTIGLLATATPVNAIRIDYASVGIDWAWDAAAGGFARTQGGTPHVDADDVQVVAANVVVAEVNRTSTGMVDTVGSPLPSRYSLAQAAGMSSPTATSSKWCGPSRRCRQSRPGPRPTGCPLRSCPVRPGSN